MNSPQGIRTLARSGRIAAAALACVLVGAVPALSQSWWPWANNNAPPVPREPVYKQPPPAAPPAAAVPMTPGNRPPICLQLEQRLALEANRGSQMREQLPRIEGEMRQADRAHQTAQAQLDRADCYEYFLFAKSLKRSRACLDLAGQADAAKRKVSELEGQRQQILQSGGRSLRDEIINELARNNCGPGYQQQARASGPFSSLWQDEDGGGPAGNRFGALPYATFRTVCVRLCDGYFFPVSFSTLPNYFDHDADVCQQRCAAPAELYYHPNPGGAVDQAISHKTKQPYTSLRTAFRFRKEFVNGCSCKQAEYVPQGTTPQPAADRRAEAGPGSR